MRLNVAILERVRISVKRTINLGNYNSVSIEAAADVSREGDEDTAKVMRELALSEAANALELAYDEFVPKKRERTDER